MTQVRTRNGLFEKQRHPIKVPSWKAFMKKPVPHSILGHNKPAGAGSGGRGLANRAVSTFLARGQLCRHVMPRPDRRYLHNNDLSGTIPPAIGNLTSLERLYALPSSPSPHGLSAAPSPGHLLSPQTYGLQACRLIKRHRGMLAV